MLAAFNLGGGEVVLVLALVLILFGVNNLPGSRRRIFRVWDKADDDAHDAGRSVGGIFGKRAAQALTVDNQVAELHNPAAFRKERQFRRTLKTLQRFVQNLLRRAMRIFTKLRTRRS